MSIRCAPTSLSSLVGWAEVSPGCSQQPLRSHRPELASRLAVGRPLDQLPELLAGVFTLCGSAHRLAARLAVSAATGVPVTVSAEEHQALYEAAARDHLRHLVVDAPRLIHPAAPADAGWLTIRACPLWRQDGSATDRWSAAADWLERDWLRASPSAWLQDLGLAAPGGDDQALQHWCTHAGPPPLRWLSGEADALRALPTPGSRLPVPGPTAAEGTAWASEIAHDLATRADAVAAPLWQGEPADTGCWTRPVALATLGDATAWHRLAGRLVELVRLVATPEGAIEFRMLDAGAAAVAPGEGLAWVDTARGRLVHWVKVAADDGGLAGGPRATAQRYRVLAPTDWNLHPRGALAQALARARCGADARRLLAAIDLCLPVTVHEGDLKTEAGQIPGAGDA